MPPQRNTEAEDAHWTFPRDKNIRLDAVSFMTIGNDAEACLREIMRDIHSFPQNMSLDLERFICRFLDPSANISFLLLSSSVPISLQQLLSVCERSLWDNPTPVRGYPQIRIAMSMSGTTLAPEAAQKLLAADFAIFEASKHSDSLSAVRSAVTGIVGTRWTNCIIGTDFGDLVTLLCRRGGMRGVLDRVGSPEAARKLQAGAKECVDACSMFAIVLSDGTFTLDLLESVSEIVSDHLPDDSYVKVSLVILPSQHALLGGGDIQLSLLRAHTVCVQ